MTTIGVVPGFIVLLALASGCEASGPNTSLAKGGPHSSMATPRPEASPSEDGARSAASTPSMMLVEDRSLVCMVNNQFMGLPQIPIDVDGRTYYGCCEMCKGRLGSDPSSRVSTDPVSGKVVDKATAVIGRQRDGRTLYFENEQTFAAFARGTAR